MLFNVSSVALTKFTGVSVTCRISLLKYSLTSVRQVLTSVSSSRWGHSSQNRVWSPWRKLLMKVTDVTVFSAGVPCGPCMTPDTLNLALAFWSICVNVFSAFPRRCPASDSDGSSALQCTKNIRMKVKHTIDVFHALCSQVSEVTEKTINASKIFELK